jgi:hypothetical protein
MQTIRNNWGPVIKRRSARDAAEREADLPEELRVKLVKIRESASPKPSRPAPIFSTLEEVYRLRCDVARSAELEDDLISFRENYMPRTKRNYLSVLIHIVLGDRITSKMRFKYTTALQLAFEEGIKPGKLMAFIREEGGLNKCVERYSKQYRS